MVRPHSFARSLRSAELEAPGLAAGTEIQSVGRPAEPVRPTGGGLRQEPLPPAPPAEDSVLPRGVE
jgi:hypothetical protein